MIDVGNRVFSGNFREGLRKWFLPGIAVLLVLDLVRQLATGSLEPSLLTGYVWNGIVFGLLIGLGGVGLSLTYDLLGFANFAHGDYMTVTAFVGWGIAWLVAGIGQFDIGSLFFLGVGGTVYPGDIGVGVAQTPIAIVFGLVVAALVGALLALAMDKVVYKSLRKAGGITLLIASIGVAFALRYLVVFVFSQQSFGLTVSDWAYPLEIAEGSVSIGAAELLLVAVAVVSMGVVHLLLTRTKLGKAMRAMADNRDLAMITGIPAERIVTFTWLIGGGVAGIAGFMAALLQGTITFQIGWTLLLLIFAGVIMGGIGSVYGAIIGGLLIGLFTRVSLVWIPPSFTEAMAFLAMIGILLSRPQGLFGGSTL